MLCALMSICLDPTHFVTCLLINFPKLLSLVTLLICSLYNLLVFAVPCGFVAIYMLGRRTSCVLPCPALSCPALSCLPVCFSPTGLFLFVLFRAVRCGQKKRITISRISISILITILTQTDMLYSYKCILCEFETYFQRKPIRPFPKKL